MRLVQFLSSDGDRRVGLVQEDGSSLRVLRDTASVYGLALETWRSASKLTQAVRLRLGDEVADFERAVVEQRLLPPLDHPDPARCFVTGTGLTHLGSAKARDEMHVKADDKEVEECPVSTMSWGLSLVFGKPLSPSLWRIVPILSLRPVTSLWA